MASVKYQLLKSDFSGKELQNALRKPFYRLFLGFDSGDHTLPHIIDRKPGTLQQFQLNGTTIPADRNWFSPSYFNKRFLRDCPTGEGARAQYDQTFPIGKVLKKDTISIFNLEPEALLYVVECRTIEQIKKDKKENR